MPEFDKKRISKMPEFDKKRIIYTEKLHFFVQNFRGVCQECRTTTNPCVSNKDATADAVRAWAHIDAIKTTSKTPQNPASVQRFGAW